MTFRGRTGIIIWIVVLILLACEVFFALYKDEFSPVVFWILMIGFGAIVVLTLMFEIRNKIVVTGDLVKICFGITTTIINISKITSLKKSISAIASDSGSLRRIEIAYVNENGVHKVFCSPRKEDEFIDLLTGCNKKIKVLN